MTGLYGVLWFLTCLFLTQQLGNWILVRRGRTTLVAVSAVCMILCYVNSIWLPRYSLPLDANVVLAALPFFTAGYLFRTVDLTKPLPMIAGVVSLFASAILLWRGVPIAYDMRSGVFGVPLLSPILALGLDPVLHLPLPGSNPCPAVEFCCSAARRSVSRHHARAQVAPRSPGLWSRRTQRSCRHFLRYASTVLAHREGNGANGCYARAVTWIGE